MRDSFITKIGRIFKRVAGCTQGLAFRRHLFQSLIGNKSAQRFQNEITQAPGEDVLMKTSLGRGHYNFKAMTKIQFKSIETVLQCQDDGKIMPM